MHTNLNLNGIQMHFFQSRKAALALAARKFMPLNPSKCSLNETEHVGKVNPHVKTNMKSKNVKSTSETANFHISSNEDVRATSNDKSVNDLCGTPISHTSTISRLSRTKLSVHRLPTDSNAHFKDTVISNSAASPDCIKSFSTNRFLEKNRANESSISPKFHNSAERGLKNKCVGDQVAIKDQSKQVINSTQPCYDVCSAVACSTSITLTPEVNAGMNCATVNSTNVIKRKFNSGDSHFIHNKDKPSKKFCPRLTKVDNVRKSSGNQHCSSASADLFLMNKTVAELVSRMPSSISIVPANARSKIDKAVPQHQNLQESTGSFVECPVKTAAINQSASIFLRKKLSNIPKSVAITKVKGCSDLVSADHEKFCNQRQRQASDISCGYRNVDQKCLQKSGSKPERRIDNSKININSCPACTVTNRIPEEICLHFLTKHVKESEFYCPFCTFYAVPKNVTRLGINAFKDDCITHMLTHYHCKISNSSVKYNCKERSDLTAEVNENLDNDKNTDSLFTGVCKNEHGSNMNIKELIRQKYTYEHSSTSPDPNVGKMSITSSVPQFERCDNYVIPQKGNFFRSDYNNARLPQMSGFNSTILSDIKKFNELPDEVSRSIMRTATSLSTSCDNMSVVTKKDKSFPSFSNNGGMETGPSFPLPLPSTCKELHHSAIDNEISYDAFKFPLRQVSSCAASALGANNEKIESNMSLESPPSHGNKYPIKTELPDKTKCQSGHANKSDNGQVSSSVNREIKTSTGSRNSIASVPFLMQSNSENINLLMPSVIPTASSLIGGNPLLFSALFQQYLSLTGVSSLQQILSNFNNQQVANQECFPKCDMPNKETKSSGQQPLFSQTFEGTVLNNEQPKAEPELTNQVHILPLTLGDEVNSCATEASSTRCASNHEQQSSISSTQHAKLDPGVPIAEHLQHQTMFSYLLNYYLEKELKTKPSSS